MFAAGISYSAMGALMGAAPLEMKEEGHSFIDSTLAIEMHVLGMFIPALFSGDLVKLCGGGFMVMVGFTILAGGAAFFYIAKSVAVFAVGLTVVGVGWNFSFVGATSLLTTTFTPAEKTGVQGVNETVVLGMLAVCITTASELLEATGWTLFVTIYLAWASVGLVLGLVLVVVSGCQLR
eukprot:m.31248 g.31248  ORF g.31248 m.31248 type:complete len:179 (+) comp14724_c0_seq2:812-1348(+)